MKGNSSKILLIVFLASFVIGCALLYTTDRYLFVFSHKTHHEMETECVQCHTDIGTSASAKDNNLPSKETCSDCHEVDGSEQCRICHSNVEKATKLKPKETELFFSHVLHVGEMEMECETCHKKAKDSSKSTDRLIPSMEACEECHDTKSSESNCGLCHTGLKDFVLRPKSHKNMSMFLTGHKREAYTRSIKYCQNCHQEDTCLACHEGRIDRNVHDRNFRFYHSIKAASDPVSCDICHRRNFCKECH